MKYIIYLDYRTGCGNYEYKGTQAKTFKEALEEAEKLYSPETVYLIRILEKVGKSYKEEDYKVEEYQAIECKRSHEVGWHANTEANSESQHYARRCVCKFGRGNTITWFEAITRLSEYK